MKNESEHEKLPVHGTNVIGTVLLGKTVFKE